MLCALAHGMWTGAGWHAATHTHFIEHNCHERRPGVETISLPESDSDNDCPVCQLGLLHSDSMPAALELNALPELALLTLSLTICSPTSQFACILPPSRGPPSLLSSI